MFKALSPWFGLSLCILGYFCATNNPASAEARLDLGDETVSEGVSFRTPSLLAQVTSDDTVNTQVTENGNTAEITGGETRGDNLFHSFQDFSVGTGNEAAFLNANDISNIFSRVTGGDISNIDGLISANGSANLFLINPAGIVFGEGARLDIGGSFYGSSASSILFEDGEFSATDLDNPPLLTINAPIGLGFRDQPGDIINRSQVNDGSGLEVATGNNLTLLGGDVSFDGGNITAPGGIVSLGGLTAAGIININNDGSLNFPEGIARGDVSLINSAEVSVLSSGGGSIFVNAKNLDLTSGSNFSAGIGEDLGSVNAQAGDIIIDATESVTLKETSPISPSISVISNIVESGAVGNAGDINITTTNLALTNGSIISTTTFGEGNTGNININATELVTLDEINSRLQTASGIYIQQTDAVGNEGELNIVTSNLALTNGGQIDASTFGESNGGSIDINATESITLDGTSIDGEFASTIANTVKSGAVGNAGAININTANLVLTNGSVISASTFGEGNGGRIEINATNSVTLDGSITDTTFRSAIENRVEMGAVGNAGEININTANLDLTNGSVISASTLAQGDGGRIDINATESVSFDGNITAIFNLVGTDAVGTGGEINITTANLNLTNGGQIVATTRGQGDAGKIDINATESITLDGTTSDGQSSGIGGVVVNDAIGNAGDINIITPNLSLTNGGRIASSTLGEGDAGRIEINATESITLDGKNPNNNLPSAIENKVEFGAVGNGGGIDIATPNLVLTNSGQISVSSLGIGDGGSISVNADNLILNNGEISAANTPTESTANNQTPQVGGNINLEIADSINLRNNSIISAKATSNANGGNLTINTNFIVAFPNQNNDIIANATQGNGGNITINTESLFGIEERPLNDFTNDINASSKFDLDGSVNINTSDINPIQGATELPSNVVEPEQNTAQACDADRGTANNGLAIAGKGGVPPAPDTPLNSENIISGNQNPAAFAIPEPIETSQGKIQPARGIKVSKSGKISLTAYRTNNAGERIPEIRPNCN